MKFYWRRYLDPGTGDGGGANTEKEALLKAIQKQVGDEIEKRGYQNADSVSSIISKTLEGLNLEALRSFDPSKIETSVRNMAAEIEKSKNTHVAGEKRNHLQEQLDKVFPQVELVIRSRGEDKTQLKFNVRAAAVMTTTNVVDDTTNALPADLIESFTLGAFVPKRYGNQYIYEIADRAVVQELEEYKTWLEEGSEQGAFAIVAEGALKPLVSTSLVRNFAKSKKIAGKYIVTEEVTKFRKEAYGIIRRLITDKLVRDYSAIVTADLEAQAAGYTGTSLDGTIVAPNDYDAIGAVAAQIQSLNFIPDVIVLNPQDAWRIRLTKDSQGRYLFPTVTENGQTVMLGIRVALSPYKAVGTFTLGESGLFKIDEEPITVRMGYGITVTGSAPVTSVVSDFDNNQFRVIVEMFFRDYIATNNIGSFVSASFATVKAALAAA